MIFKNEGKIFANGNKIEWNKEKMYFKICSEDDESHYYNLVQGNRELLKSLLKHYRKTILMTVVPSLDKFLYSQEKIHKEIGKLNLAAKEGLRFENDFWEIVNLYKKYKEIKIESAFFENYYLYMDVTYCYRIICWMLDEKSLFDEKNFQDD